MGQNPLSLGINPGLDARRGRTLRVDTLGADDVRVSTWDGPVQRACAG